MTLSAKAYLEAKGVDTNALTVGQTPTLYDQANTDGQLCALQHSNYCADACARRSDSVEERERCTRCLTNNLSCPSDTDSAVACCPLAREAMDCTACLDKKQNIVACAENQDETWYTSWWFLTIAGAFGAGLIGLIVLVYQYYKKKPKYEKRQKKLAANALRQMRGEGQKTQPLTTSLFGPVYMGHL